MAYGEKTDLSKATTPQRSTVDQRSDGIQCAQRSSIPQCYLNTAQFPYSSESLGRALRCLWPQWLKECPKSDKLRQFTASPIRPPKCHFSLGNATQAAVALGPSVAVDEVNRIERRQNRKG